jgi:hypothetical protein
VTRTRSRSVSPAWPISPKLESSPTKPRNGTAGYSLNNPEVSPHSGLWLAQRAYDAGDYAAARDLTDLLIGGDARQGVLADTWSLRYGEEDDNV